MFFCIGLFLSKYLFIANDKTLASFFSPFSAFWAFCFFCCYLFKAEYGNNNNNTLVVG